MTVWNLGSINADLVYAVPHIPAPGETLASTGRRVYLGGKGANMSVAIARAGGKVEHIGALGPDGDWARERLMGAGVGCDHIAAVEIETAQAIIAVDPQGENAIILHPGANNAIPRDVLETALGRAARGDWFVTQNETVLQKEGATLAKERGLKVAYAAAPFDAARTQDVLPLTDLLILNAVEAEQLRAATGQGPADLPAPDVIVTLGAKGCDWVRGPETRHFDAIPVPPVDTTGAGDTFTGYLLAGLDAGEPMERAIERAQRAGALMVTRPGTADAIPTAEEVAAFSGG